MKKIILKIKKIIKIIIKMIIKIINPTLKLKDLLLVKALLWGRVLFLSGLIKEFLIFF